ncbi:hypothetical protein TetV_524 [Tetraselmis virus 1]|uniref:Uncharacterized protein n=1 Tax=Tetraselmis virus 1 TaxID=2060617 RepID=A0A2P0VNW7_9VIRU|nr:hypothetical protein QJ968_gp530 [Tetraselmis virus 1]AUF82606.1 hypothetical protein TetV_524 [Tetraselmis virus 1]
MPVYYVDVDSRNISANHTTSDYVVELTETLKNVISIELQYGVFNKTGVENYAVLSIGELPKTSRVGNISYNGESFTIIPLTQTRTIYSPALFYPSYMGFDLPIERLRKLSIQFRNYQGELEPIGEHSMLFKITTTIRSETFDTQYPERWNKSDIMFTGM